MSIQIKTTRENGRAVIELSQNDLMGHLVLAELILETIENHMSDAKEPETREEIWEFEGTLGKVVQAKKHISRAVEWATSTEKNAHQWLNAEVQP